MNHVYKYFESAKKEVIERIGELKAQKFSLTLDEWTSIRNRRYLNINIHSNSTFFNLGLILISGKCPAEEIERLTEIKLNEFNLSMTDIVAATIDGAAVMVKFGRSISAMHQQCYNHAFHLPIVDVIFKKKGEVAVAEPAYLDYMDDDEDSENDEDDECDNDDGDEDGECSSGYERADIHKTLTKLRTTVRLFKSSPVRNSVLQKYVVETNGKELTLLLDCRTKK